MLRAVPLAAATAATGISSPPRQACTKPLFFRTTFDGSFKHGVCAWGCVIFAATRLRHNGQPEWHKICVAGAPLTHAEMEGHIKSAMLAEIYALSHALSPLVILTWRGHPHRWGPV